MKISRGHRAGCALRHLSAPPVGEGGGWTLRGQLLHFPALPGSPLCPYACDPGKRKAIIRGREGMERPGEMNYGTPGGALGQG